ncbi:MAG: hypothetical protein IPH16_06270 [Haliscomenobacter sp.]|nr:hypothetical protein [Haliscomenobacter sp.]
MEETFPALVQQQQQQRITRHRDAVGAKALEKGGEAATGNAWMTYIALDFIVPKIWRNWHL